MVLVNNEVCGQYGGEADLIDGDEEFAVVVSLTASVELLEVRTVGPHTTRMHGTVRWFGNVRDGLSKRQKERLISKGVALRLPDGKVGRASVIDMDGLLKGHDLPPFGDCHPGGPVP